MNTPVSLVQALRSVKRTTRTTTASPDYANIVYIDVRTDPVDKNLFILWKDVQLAFANAIHVRHQSKVLSFLKGPDFNTLKPPRFAAVTDMVLEVVVGDQPVRDGLPTSGVQQLTSPESPSWARRTESSTNATRRDPVYGLEEQAMDCYSHIDHPAFKPRPRAPQLTPSPQEEEVDIFTDNPSANNNSPAPANNSQPEHSNSTSNNNIQPANKITQTPQDLTTASAANDIAPITLKATLGNKNAQLQLRDMYKDGNGIEQDNQAAHYWYLKAANQRDASAQNNLGDIYSQGLGVKRNQSTALDWYLKAANQGDALIQNKMGDIHRFGRGVPLDYSKALDWYLKAVDQADATGRFNIAQMYNYGLGVSLDFKKAMHWYLKSAAQEYALAQSSIGDLYANNHGVA
ncbi:hypothetical protein BGZ47_009314 [Haplosporangium gracile]|nr:hypothetical protein BGZ47_009314 [Haplosporangium gracile]